MGNTINRGEGGHSYEEAEAYRIENVKKAVEFLESRNQSDYSIIVRYLQDQDKELDIDFSFEDVNHTPNGSTDVIKTDGNTSIIRQEETSAATFHGPYLGASQGIMRITDATWAAKLRRRTLESASLRDLFIWPNCDPETLLDAVGPGLDIEYINALDDKEKARLWVGHRLESSDVHEKPAGRRKGGDFDISIGYKKPKTVNDTPEHIIFNYNDESNSLNLLSNQQGGPIAELLKKHGLEILPLTALSPNLAKYLSELIDKGAVIN